MEGNKKKKFVHWFIIGSFVALYFLVSIISLIHVIDFFELSNSSPLAITLAIAFEIGAAASLASIIAMDKMNKTIVWGLFIILTFMQMMGNTFYAYTNLEAFSDWIELFGLTDLTDIEQKRILAIVSGAVLPIVALGFIKALVDYIRPSDKKKLKEETKESNVFLTAEHTNLSDSTKEPEVFHTEEKDESLLPEEEIVGEHAEQLTKEETKEVEKIAKDSGINKTSTKFKELVEEYINKTKK